MLNYVYPYPVILYTHDTKYNFLFWNFDFVINKKTGCLCALALGEKYNSFHAFRDDVKNLGPTAGSIKPILGLDTAKMYIGQNPYQLTEAVLEPQL